MSHKDMSTKEKLKWYDMAKVGKVIPWRNVKSCMCDECKERGDFCFLIKGQWLCMVCRGEKYGKKRAA